VEIDKQIVKERIIYGAGGFLSGLLFYFILTILL